MKPSNSSRRKFIQQSALLTGGALLMESLGGNSFANIFSSNSIKVNGHLWIYASKFPPHWDCTPHLERVFADLSYAGVDGLELMESTLRYDDSVKRINSFIKQYQLPVSGSSYGVGFNMWDIGQHQKILEDVKMVVPRLKQVNGKTFGISTGDARRLKTEKELDAQAAILHKLIAICNDNDIELNLHNHTYEVNNNLHELKGMLERMPGIKLGPDLNWLIRAGIQPVDFINNYGKQLSYLHIRDQYADGRWTEYVGEGVTDFAAIAKALREQNFKGSCAIELAFEKDFDPKNPLKENWKMSRQFVKKVFGW